MSFFTWRPLQVEAWVRRKLEEKKGEKKYFPSPLPRNIELFAKKLERATRERARLNRNENLHWDNVVVPFESSSVGDGGEGSQGAVRPCGRYNRLLFVWMSSNLGILILGEYFMTFLPLGFHYYCHLSSSQFVIPISACHLYCFHGSVESWNQFR